MLADDASSAGAALGIVGLDIVGVGGAALGVTALGMAALVVSRCAGMARLVVSRRAAAAPLRAPLAAPRAVSPRDVLVVVPTSFRTGVPLVPLVD